MTDPEVVRARIAAINDDLELLESRRSRSADQLSSDRVEAYAILHALQRIAQSVLDIGAHILADSDLGNMREYRDIIISLGVRGILPNEFARRFAGIAGVRNVIVHEYLDIDYERIVLILAKLDDIREFVRHIMKYVEKTP